MELRNVAQKLDAAARSFDSREHVGRGVSRDPSDSRRLKSVNAPVGMTAREVTSYCALHTAAMPRNNSPGQEFVVADGLRRPSLQKRRKSAPGSEGGRYIARRQAEACVTKPQDRRTRETDLKVGYYKATGPHLWHREAAVQASVELAITSRLF